MINDLKSAISVNKNGNLETTISKEDIEKINTFKEIYMFEIYNLLSRNLSISMLKSEQISILEIMKELNHPDLEYHLTIYGLSFNNLWKLDN
jgi:hypothetical protein